LRTYEETTDGRVYQRWQQIEAGGPVGWLRITTTDERTRRSVTTLGQEILALAALTATAMLTAFGLILRRAYRAISTHESRLSQSNLMLSDAANRDPLTQLGNRSALNQALQTFISRASESGAGFALCFIDLDGFKPVNDIHGHKAGDEVLRVVAQRIKSTARESDFAARLGGDEFVLLVGDIDNVSELGPVFNRLMRAVSEPIALSGLSITIGLSIGASIFPKDGATAELLLSHADEAMYRAKKSGGQQVAVW
jgi:diguanylate cyclase (GGDEF)-like protein